MQNLDVEEAIQKNRKMKLEIKKELGELIINGKSKENTEMLGKVNNVTASEDAAKVVKEFEQIIKNEKNDIDIIWLTYHQRQILQKIKERERFVSMVSEFGVSKSTIVFTIALLKPINKRGQLRMWNF